MSDRIHTFIGPVPQAEAVHERPGATVHVAHTADGGQPTTVIHPSTSESGATYGAFIDAVAADAAWTSRWVSARAGVSAEMV